MSDALDLALEDIKQGKAKPLYLIHGEEFLARRAAEAICEALVPPAKRDFNFTQVDGAAGGKEIGQHLDTVPMFRGTKVVFVEAADVLLAKRDVAKELARAKDLWQQSSRRKDAARRVLSIVAPAGWTYRELDADGEGAPTKTRWKKEVGFEPSADDLVFFTEVGKYAADIELKAPKDDAEAFLRAVTQGPPKGNHLVLLCEEFDPQHPVAKAVAERGLVMKRGVDRLATGKGYGIASLDIRAIAQEVLGPLKKKLGPGAAELLKDRVGEAMRQMASELEKLAMYVGDRSIIEERDVDILVAPLREEEFFELGNAIGEADTARALKLIEDDLARGKHPLLLLGGIVASVRRLALDAARLAKIPGALGSRELQLKDFEKTIFPAYLQLASGDREPKPFSVWSNYKRVRKHGAKKLLRALILCAEVDAALKRGGAGPLAIERLVMAICGVAPH
jgi:DNA polymerase-3 subunit delta